MQLVHYHFIWFLDLAACTDEIKCYYHSHGDTKYFKIVNNIRLILPF